MTDVSKLEPLAKAISTSSSRIRAWALEQTRVTVEQEARLRQLEAPTPEPPPAPVPAGAKLRWPPPPLQPGFITRTGGGTHTLDANTDYLIQVGDYAWTADKTGRSHGLNIIGGRNVVVVGGRLRATQTSVVDDGSVILIDGGNPAGTVHIEGVDGFAANGITIRTPRLVQVQNSVIVARAYQDNHSSIHPDVVQFWESAARGRRLRMHRVSGYSTMTYVSNFLNAGDPLAVEMYDCDMHALPPLNGTVPLIGLNHWWGDPASSVYTGSNLWHETSYESATQRRDLGDVARQFGLQFTPAHAQYEIWDAAGNRVFQSGYNQASGSGSGLQPVGGRQGDEIRYLTPALAGMRWKAQIAPVSAGAGNDKGRFAALDAGPGYVSPGYQ